MRYIAVCFLLISPYCFSDSGVTQDCRSEYINRGFDNAMSSVNYNIGVMNLLMSRPAEVYSLVSHAIDSDMEYLAKINENPHAYDRVKRRYQTVKDAYEDYLEARKKFEAALKEAEEAKEKKPETSI